MRFDLIKIRKEREDKFVYYISGLNVASIGFTISKTYGEIPNNFHDIVLALAIVGWVTSTTLAFRWIFIQFRTMETNLKISDIKNGFYDKSEFDDKEIELELYSSKYQLSKDSVHCVKLIKWLILFFILGMVLFIAWRILETIDLMNR